MCSSDVAGSNRSDCRYKFLSSFLRRTVTAGTAAVALSELLLYVDFTDSPVAIQLAITVTHDRLHSSPWNNPSLHLFFKFP